MANITNELKSHFLRLYQIALSDDDFSPLELKMLYKFAEERNIDKSQLDEILLRPDIETNIPDNVETKVEYLYDFARMIWADGIVTEDERITLQKYCKKFGFLEENAKEIGDFLIDKASKGADIKEILVEIN